MSELRKAAEKAQEALKCCSGVPHWPALVPVIEALRTALAEPETTVAKDAYDGAMEEMRIWKKRALEAEEINRKFVAEVNGPSFMGEPVMEDPEQAAPIGRLVSYIGRGPYPKQGYTVARTWDELPRGAYPYDWEEGENLYTHPRREPLTPEEIWNNDEILSKSQGKLLILDLVDLVRAVEAAHGITGEKT